MRWLTATVLLLSLAAAPAISLAAEPEASIVASGDGEFVVRQQDVDAVKDFFEKNTPFRTTPKEYETYTIQVMLFAREAEKAGLDLPPSFQPVSPMHAKVALADLYAQLLLDNYKLDPTVAESYYAAYPERFLRSQDVAVKTGEVWGESDLQPFDQVKDQIESTLKLTVKRRVVAEAFQRLTEQYHVKRRN